MGRDDTSVDRLAFLDHLSGNVWRGNDGNDLGNGGSGLDTCSEVRCEA
jgi:hypothetical protein